MWTPTPKTKFEKPKQNLYDIIFILSAIIGILLGIIYLLIK